MKLDISLLLTVDVRLNLNKKIYVFSVTWVLRNPFFTVFL